ncbi:MAG: hypothetical protein MJD61_06275 [Proteobacteria bacterium]|nr:hypothetical protein [Pseudomonadota bacterium]
MPRPPKVPAELVGRSEPAPDALPPEGDWESDGMTDIQAEEFAQSIRPTWDTFAPSAFPSAGPASIHDSGPVGDEAITQDIPISVPKAKVVRPLVLTVAGVALVSWGLAWVYGVNLEDAAVLGRAAHPERAAAPAAAPRSPNKPLPKSNADRSLPQSKRAKERPDRRHGSPEPAVAKMLENRTPRLQPAKSTEPPKTTKRASGLPEPALTVSKPGPRPGTTSESSATRPAASRVAVVAPKPPEASRKVSNEANPRHKRAVATATRPDKPPAGERSVQDTAIGPALRPSAGSSSSRRPVAAAPSVKPEQARPKPRVHIRIAANPAHARLLWDGERVDNPFDKWLPKGGRRSLRAEAEGYAPVRLSVSLNRNRSLVLRLKQRSKPRARSERDKVARAQRPGQAAKPDSPSVRPSKPASPKAKRKKRETPFVRSNPYQ